jgi:hypothetical protein
LGKLASIFLFSWDFIAAALVVIVCDKE